jgi:hypothetical protein
VYEKVNDLLDIQVLGDMFFCFLEISLAEADKQIDGF